MFSIDTLEPWMAEGKSKGRDEPKVSDKEGRQEGRKEVSKGQSASWLLTFVQVSHSRPDRSAHVHRARFYRSLACSTTTYRLVTFQFALLLGITVPNGFCSSKVPYDSPSGLKGCMFYVLKLLWVIVGNYG